MASNQTKQSGQALVEGVLGLLLLSITMISLGHAFNGYWEKTHCDAVLFRDTRNKLQGSIVLSATVFRETPAGITGTRFCQGKFQSLTLPKLESHPKWDKK